jgi:hypothetical protein
MRRVCGPFPQNQKGEIGTLIQAVYEFFENLNFLSNPFFQMQPLHFPTTLIWLVRELLVPQEKRLRLEWG